MTTNNHVGANTDPDEPNGIDWEGLAAEVREQAGLPIPSEVAPGADALDCQCGSDICLACTLTSGGRLDVDPEADAELWPPVLDAKGRPTGELARPNPAAMRAALDRVAAVDPAEVDLLANAVSEAEARAIIAQAARQREHERKLAAEVAERRVQLAAEGARRQAEHEARLAEDRRRRENRAEAALERRSRALDPTGRVVRLAAAERFVPWIAVVPAVLAAVLGAVNVGVMLDHLSPSTHVINWMVEPLLTLPVLAILAAQILGAVGSGASDPYRRLEWALIAVAVGLNVGLHVAVDGLTPTAAVWAIVPAGLAISVHLVPQLIRNVREALADAGQSAETTGPVPAGSTSTVPRPMQVDAVVDPDRRTDAEVAEAFQVAVQNGQTDPRTGRPIDPSSAESIRRTIRVSAARARALRDQYQAALKATD